MSRPGQTETAHTKRPLRGHCGSVRCRQYSRNCTLSITSVYGLVPYMLDPSHIFSATQAARCTTLRASSISLLTALIALIAASLVQSSSQSSPDKPPHSMQQDSQPASLAFRRSHRGFLPGSTDLLAPGATTCRTRQKGGTASLCEFVSSTLKAPLHPESATSGSVPAAEKLTRDIFVEAFSNLNAVYDDDAFAAWLYHHAAKTVIANQQGRSPEVSGRPLVVGESFSEVQSGTEELSLG